MPIFAEFNDQNNQPQQAVFGFNCRRSGFVNIRVTAENGALKINTPYNSAFVGLLKAEIPANARKWDALSKCWLVSRDHADAVKRLIDTCYQVEVQMPTVIAASDAEPFEIEFQADYVANCRDGFSNVHASGSWNAKIPEAVLRKFFKQESDSREAGTLYALLGIDKTATEPEIKKAYKRAARQWHPDVCKEPDAREMFEKVKSAYDVLGNFEQRARYNAGLAFQAMAGVNRHFAYKSKYASFVPLLRCGLLKVKAVRELGVLIVKEILEWNDIENEYGQIMVSFWAGESWSAAWV